MDLRPQPAPHPQQSTPHSPHPRAASRTGLGPCPLSADQQLSRLGASPGTLSLAMGSNMMPGSEDLAFLVLPGSLARPQAEKSSLSWLTDSCKPSACLSSAEPAAAQGWGWRPHVDWAGTWGLWGLCLQLPLMLQAVRLPLYPLNFPFGEIQEGWSRMSGDTFTGPRLPPHPAATVATGRGHYLNSN